MPIYDVGQNFSAGGFDGGYGVVGVDSGFVYMQDFDGIIYRLPKTP